MPTLTGVTGNPARRCRPRLTRPTTRGSSSTSSAAPSRSRTRATRTTRSRVTCAANSFSDEHGDGNARVDRAVLHLQGSGQHTGADAGDGTTRQPAERREPRRSATCHGQAVHRHRLQRGRGRHDHADLSVGLIVIDSGTALTVSNVTQVNATTWQYSLAGPFTAGQVNVSWAQGSWTAGSTAGCLRLGHLHADVLRCERRHVRQLVLARAADCLRRDDRACRHVDEQGHPDADDRGRVQQRKPRRSARPARA